MTVSNPLEYYTLDELQKRTSEKWQNYPSDILPMWVAEMDTQPPKQLVDTLKCVIDSGDLGYLSMSNFNKYVEAFCNFSSRHWGGKYAVESIADTTDVVSGCRKVIDAWLEHNKENTVIISTPVYPPFINKYTYGYKILDAPLTAPKFSLTGDAAESETVYRLDFVALEQAFKVATSSGNKAVYALCNPNNPTGTVHTRDELQMLSNLSAKYNVLVVSDEIHGVLVTKRNLNTPEHSAFVPYLSIADVDFAVTVTSASKTFSIPSIKAALVIPSSHQSKKASDLIWNSGLFAKASCGNLGSLAQTICLNEGDKWLSALINGINDNFTLFEKLSKEYFPLIKFIRPEGTYFIWADFSAYYDKIGLRIGDSISEYFIKNAKVAFNDGRTFTDISRGGSKNNDICNKYSSFVRINLATNQNIITEACKRIGKSLRIVNY